MNKIVSTYGAEVDARELSRFLEHWLEINTVAERTNQPKTPICIWGKHGIGKTEIVRNFAHVRNMQFSYLSPAQFEEMGDLLGMPEIRNGQTHLNPPSWVPEVKGPGILLLDDINRADERILRGLMQLLQQYRMASWELPADWHIMLTANPDLGDYSVTPLDPAMLTRMMHVTLRFDPGAWAAWAMNAGIDGHFIQFVVTFPRLVDGERCTARTLTQFYQGISPSPNERPDDSLIRTIGYATIGPDPTETYLDFVRQKLHDLPDPEKILETKAFGIEIESPLKRLVIQEDLKVDLLAGLQMRLLNRLNDKKGRYSNLQLENLKAYLKMEWVPADLKFIMVQEMAKANDKQLDKVLEDPQIGKLLMIQ